MKYLLSQEEYDNLRATSAAVIAGNKADVQTFCTRVANEMPIKVAWREKVEPWGCILNLEPERNPGYCDECPAQDFCPHESKEWSQ